jgi:hypothetical protein
LPKELEFWHQGKKFKLSISKHLPEEIGKADKLTVRIIRVEPIVHKVRTRYDPELQAFGDPGASIPVEIGYSPKFLAQQRNMFLMVSACIGLLALGQLNLVPVASVSLPIFLVPYVESGFAILCGVFLLPVWLRFLANYLKARDISKELKL